MKDFIKFIPYYIICLLCVSACWVGFEYVIEGAVHTSKVDSIIAMVLSYFIAEFIYFKRENLW